MPADKPIALTGNAVLDAILGDRQWDVGSLTFSFPTLASVYEADYRPGVADNAEEPDTGFGALSVAQQSGARAILAQVAGFTT